LELEGVHGTEIGIALDESVGIEKMFDPFLGRLREMIFAPGANALVLGELDFVHDLRAARAFAPETLGHFALLLMLRLESRSFKNCHVGQARAAVAA
jgi:hypothetical protein